MTSNSQTHKDGRVGEVGNDFGERVQLLLADGLVVDQERIKASPARGLNSAQSPAAPGLALLHRACPLR